MPIYEYQCAECNKNFEAFQKINDEPLTECRFCNGKVEQLISQTSFQLKGGGWYVTDYAKKSTNSKAGDPAPTAPKTDSAEKSSENKSDSATKGSGNSGSRD